MNLFRRRRIRKIQYIINYGMWRYYFDGIRWFHQLCLSAARKTVSQGFVFTDESANLKGVPAFMATTTTALHLIQQNDPRRFRIIQREVSTIRNVELTEGGNYIREFRQVSVDFSRYFKNSRSFIDKQNEHYEWYLARYAAMIVHEATHGRLYSLNFPYNKVTRVRIERICRAEEQRFAARLKSENYDFSQGLVPKFSARDWDFHWKSSFLQRTKQAITIIMRRCNKG